jgi:hypothetical protein
VRRANTIPFEERIETRALSERGFWGSSDETRELMQSLIERLLAIFESDPELIVDEKKILQREALSCTADTCR